MYSNDTRPFPFPHCLIRKETVGYATLIKDQNKLTKEHAVLDNHEDKVENLMECPKDLVVTTESVMPGMDDHRPVVKSITGRGRTPQPRTESDAHLDESQDNCRSQGIGHVRVRTTRRKLKSSDTDLQGIKRNVLFIDDYESL